MAEGGDDRSCRQLPAPALAAIAADTDSLWEILRPELLDNFRRLRFDGDGDVCDGQALRRILSDSTHWSLMSRIVRLCSNAGHIVEGESAALAAMGHALRCLTEAGWLRPVAQSLAPVEVLTDRNVGRLRQLATRLSDAALPSLRLLPGEGYAMPEFSDLLLQCADVRRIADDCGFVGVDDAQLRHLVEDSCSFLPCASVLSDGSVAVHAQWLKATLADAESVAVALRHLQRLPEDSLRRQHDGCVRSLLQAASRDSSVPLRYVLCAFVQSNLYEALLLPEDFARGCSWRRALAELFVLADRRRYAVGARPSLELRLETSACLVVGFNDVGYSATDVDAPAREWREFELKAAFLLSNRPLVFSNGQQFALRLSRSRQGETLVSARRLSPDDAAVWQRRLGDAGGTNLVLPLRRQLPSLRCVDTRWLLGADKLQRLLLRQRLGDGDGDGDDRAVCVQLLRNSPLSATLSVFDVADASLLSSTTWRLVADDPDRWRRLAVVVPEDALEPSDRLPILVDSDVPTRGYGLRFLVVGAFQLDASKELLDVDSARNAQLLRQLPRLVASVLREFGDLADWRIRDFLHYLQLLPLPHEVDADLDGLADSVLDTVGRQLRLPSAGGELVDCSRLFYSCPVAVVDVAVAAASPSGANVLRRLAHPRLDEFFRTPRGRQLADKLGLVRFKAESVLETLLADLVAMATVRVAEWPLLAEVVNATCEERVDDDRLLARLSELPLLPCQPIGDVYGDGDDIDEAGGGEGDDADRGEAVEFVRPTDTCVCLPCGECCDSVDAGRRRLLRRSILALARYCSSIRLLHPRFLTTSVGALVRHNLISCFGVISCATVVEYVARHCLPPVLKSQTERQLRDVDSRERLALLTLFVKEFADVGNCPADRQLAASLPVLTECGRLLRPAAGDCVYFSSHYCPDLALDHIVGDDDDDDDGDDDDDNDEKVERDGEDEWRWLHAGYLQAGVAYGLRPASRQSWLAFFADLGVRAQFRRRQLPGGDCQLPAAAAVVRAPARLAAKARLFRYLADSWQVYERHLWLADGSPSQFLRLLRSSRWIPAELVHPATAVQQEEKTKETKEKEEKKDTKKEKVKRLYRAGELFARTEAAAALLVGLAPMLREWRECDRLFLEDIGFRTQVDADLLRNLMASWHGRRSRLPMRRVVGVYSLLSRAAFFDTAPVLTSVFVPDTLPGVEADDPVVDDAERLGSFVPVGELAWSELLPPPLVAAASAALVDEADEEERSDIEDSLKVLKKNLRLSYPQQLREFFLAACRVGESLDFRQLGAALRIVGYTDASREAAWRVVVHMAAIGNDAGFGDVLWVLRRIYSARCLPTPADAKFCSLAERPFLVGGEDDELLVADCELLPAGVASALRRRPRCRPIDVAGQPPDVAKLLRATFKIPSLGEAVDARRAVDAPTRPCRRLLPRANGVLRAVQFCLYAQHRLLYGWLCDRGLRQHLKALRLHETDAPLLERYSLTLVADCVEVSACELAELPDGAGLCASAARVGVSLDSLQRCLLRLVYRFALKAATAERAAAEAKAEGLEAMVSSLRLAVRRLGACALPAVGDDDDADACSSVWRGCSFATELPWRLANLDDNDDHNDDDDDDNDNVGKANGSH